MNSTLTLAQEFLAAIEPTGGETEAAPVTGYEFITTRELMERSYELTWLIPQLLVRGQPGVVGGPQKVLKTSIVTDMAVSLASGQPFLNRFTVLSPVRVGMLSGESGEATLKSTIRRVCQSKSIDDPRELPIYWSFRMPPLSNPDVLRQLSERIQDDGIDVMVIDPLYLGMCKNNSRINASNLYDTGPLLDELSHACLDAGATPLVVHHTRKEKSKKYQPIELDELSFSGISEYARQWLLIGRREAYVPDSGSHRLWLSAGGSAGHSGCWGVNVELGQMGENFNGRTWNVDVRPFAEVAPTPRSRQPQSDTAAASHVSPEMLAQWARDQILSVLRWHPDGETRSVIRRECGMDRDRCVAAINELLQRGEIVADEVIKAGGRSQRAYPGFRLASSAPEPATGSADGRDGVAGTV